MNVRLGIAAVGGLLACGLAAAVPARADGFGFGFHYGSSRPVYYGGCGPSYSYYSAPVYYRAPRVYYNDCAPRVVYRDSYCAPRYSHYRSRGYGGGFYYRGGRDCDGGRRVRVSIHRR